ncbi:MAG: hypothetical protein POELPBGB_00950 [Bacteroidia bacterium]|nr:hypothetical protein [Bacteroidia bacterium]
MRWLIVIFLFVSVASLKAQVNLVPNGDFETNSSCPNNEAQLYLATPWISTSDNDINLSSTPDYFNQCATSAFCDVPLNLHSFQLAHSGDGYSGIVLFDVHATTREYIEVPLTSTLLANTSYYFEMYVNLSNLSSYTTDAIGVYFSDTVVTGITGNNPLPFIPQLNNAIGNFIDTLSWILISGNYTATGGENVLIIGNFNNDINTTIIEEPSGQYGASYCFIDDVSVIALQTPLCIDTNYIPTILTSENLVLCGVDTVWMIAENGYDQYLWSNGETTRNLEATSAGDYFVDALIDTCWFRSDTIHVDAATPVADFTVTFDDFVATFTNLSTDAVTWLWNFGDPNETIADSSTQENPVWTYTMVADVPVTACLFAYYDLYCYDIYCEEIISGSISANSLSLLNIYPNPATTSITIEFPASSTFKNAELSILTITGQVVNQTSIQNLQTTIDVAGYSKGLYLFNVQTGDEVVVKKVIVK